MSRHTYGGFGAGRAGFGAGRVDPLYIEQRIDEIENRLDAIETSLDIQ